MCLYAGDIPNLKNSFVALSPMLSMADGKTPKLRHFKPWHHHPSQISHGDFKKSTTRIRHGRYLTTLIRSNPNSNITFTKNNLKPLRHQPKYPIFKTAIAKTIKIKPLPDFG